MGTLIGSLLELRLTLNLTSKHSSLQTFTSLNLNISSRRNFRLGLTLSRVELLEQVRWSWPAFRWLSTLVEECRFLLRSTFQSPKSYVRDGLSGIRLSEFEWKWLAPVRQIRQLHPEVIRLKQFVKNDPYWQQTSHCRYEYAYWITWSNNITIKL